MTTVDAAVELVRARLDANPDIDVFIGEPTANVDTDGRAHPYAAIWPSPGRTDPTQEALCGIPGQRVWTVQITAAGGDLTRAMRAAAAVQTELTGWRPAADTSLMREVLDPGPYLHDTSVAPTRWFTPLQYAVEL